MVSIRSIASPKRVEARYSIMSVRSNQGVQFPLSPDGVLIVVEFVWSGKTFPDRDVFVRLMGKKEGYFE
jgi:hypothetical protein